MRGLFCFILSFLTLESILSARADSLDEIFQANEKKILFTPVVELGGYVFFSGRVRPASASAQSKTIAQSMARTQAEGNVRLLKARQISFDGTILAGRSHFQQIVFNAWYALGHRINYR